MSLFPIGANLTEIETFLILLSLTVLVLTADHVILLAEAPFSRPPAVTFQSVVVLVSGIDRVIFVALGSHSLSKQIDLGLVQAVDLSFIYLFEESANQSSSSVRAFFNALCPVFRKIFGLLLLFELKQFLLDCLELDFRPYQLIFKLVDLNLHLTECLFCAICVLRCHLVDETNRTIVTIKVLSQALYLTSLAIYFGLYTTLNHVGHHSLLAFVQIPIATTVDARDLFNEAFLSVIESFIEGVGLAAVFLIAFYHHFGKLSFE